ncbi:MAG: SUMF1/EgtB/PvdO family nonheme iron enzyme, partial [Spirochaetota bacterium]|nr:SUMF1/EgtB/PvdO family nonheme iron enzyme [Spirochaetota bacterium]
IYADTVPSGALVYVDNVYKGTTPVKIFVNSGEREIKIEKKYFETISTSKNIDGRIFGTLIFPKKLKINEEIKIIDPEGFLENRFKELSSYALIDDYYERYQMPPLISKTVKEYLAGANSSKNNLLYNFLYNMRVNLGSMDMVNDYIYAVSIASGLNDENQSLLLPDMSILFDYFNEKKNHNNLNLSILSTYPDSKRASSWQLYSKIDGINTLVEYFNTIQTDYIEMDMSQTNDKYILNGNTFIAITSKKYTSGKSIPPDPEILLTDDYISSFPHNESVDNFYIREKEVTRGEYALFLNENPEWKINNIDNLITNKLVNKEYLVSQNLGDKEFPISNISWHAATAYCKWLETKLPPNMSNYEVRLPTEAQWETAALLNRNSNTKTIFKESGADSSEMINFARIGSADLYDTMGNLWEWCDNWYFPTDTINGSFGLPDSPWDGVEKSVRGGSWANAVNDIDLTTRGSQDPAWCTPFLGFRPVMVER